ncbi:uncharacterized protein LOC135137920 [Zophobas morio]|uniref:uncharacterized protein LOC135137920 n=1 Tax=Zophobas morio TaxID=2755281 RepID=UPI003083617D
MAIRCKKCNKNIGRNDEYINCRQTCGANYHISCVNLSKSAFSSLKESRLINEWSCGLCSTSSLTVDDCQKNELTASIPSSVTSDSLNILPDTLATIFNDFSSAVNKNFFILSQQITDLKNENTKLREEISKLTAKLHVEVPQVVNDTVKSPSYSDTLKNTTAVVIRPKDVTQTIAKTKSDIISNIQPDSEPGIAKVKFIKNGGIVLNCEHPSELKKLSQLKDLSDKYEISDLKTPKPKLRISGISSDIDEQQIIPFLIKQNKHIFTSSPAISNKSVDKGNISLYYQNVRGLNSKLLRFSNAVAACAYDLIALSETWLHSGVNDSEVFDQNYEIIRRDRDLLRTNKQTGGGVLIAIRLGLHYTEINLSNTPFNNLHLIDIVCVKMKIHVILLSMELRRSIKREISIAYNAFIKNSEDMINTDPSTFWGYIRRKRRHTGIPSCVTLGDTVVTGAKNIANACNLNKVKYDNTNVNINVSIISENEVLEAINRIKSNNVQGPDGIPAFIIKDYCWKLSKIIPVHKGKIRTAVENYRPVSILNNFAKIFESLIYKQLYFQVAASITERQHGFMSGRSTVTNLLCVTQFIADSIDCGLQTDVIYLDFSKAFDKLDHGDRKQYVHCCGYDSDVITVLSGVPQGSVLGPLLFLLFINDISNELDVEFSLYADDIKIYNRDCGMVQFEQAFVKSR